LVWATAPTSTHPALWHIGTSNHRRWVIWVLPGYVAWNGRIKPATSTREGPCDRKNPSTLTYRISLEPVASTAGPRTERERVEAGLQPYASEDVPPAADATVPYDPDA
jgi:hypothetical protein